MRVRAEALAWALARLPEPKSDGPRVFAIKVPELAEHIVRGPITGMDGRVSDTIQLQELVFRREVFAEGRRRWYEWVLDVADGQIRRCQILCPDPGKKTIEPIPRTR